MKCKLVQCKFEQCGSRIETLYRSYLCMNKVLSLNGPSHRPDPSRPDIHGSNPLLQHRMKVLHTFGSCYRCLCMVQCNSCFRVGDKPSETFLLRLGQLDIYFIRNQTQIPKSKFGISTCIFAINFFPLQLQDFFHSSPSLSSKVIFVAFVV